MPYSPKVPTPAALLSAMKPGISYQPHRLAAILGKQSVHVKPVLLEMVSTGSVNAIKARKGFQFILTGTEHLRRVPKEKPVIDPATVAQPRTFAVLTGELTGYVDEITRRRTLAMMVRPR